jgi:tetratricopeptide (TPR) repeat protein
MGWIILAVLGGATMLLLIRLGVGRALWSMAGAALMLGAAGYALQGRPAVPASPPVPTVPAAADDAQTIALRDQMFGRFTLDGAYLIAADAMTRSGDRRAAVQALLGGIRTIPDSMMLWTELGTALAAHDGGQMSPPALFAFQQAERLAPRHPGPPFFEGLAQIRAGNAAAARPLWARALALTPPGLPYRAELAGRLTLLDRYLEMAGPRPAR